MEQDVFVHQEKNKRGDIRDHIDDFGNGRRTKETVSNDAYKTKNQQTARARANKSIVKTQGCANSSRPPV